MTAQTAPSGLIEGALADDYRAEVLNLGVGGWQSTDIVNAAGRHIDELSPELAVYGVCLDDFEGYQARFRRDVSRFNETVLTAAGYFREHNGRLLPVSPWEGHPSAEARRIFADTLLRRLTGHAALERCRK